MSHLSLSYDNPVSAVFLRGLAWELYVAKENLTVQDGTGQVQAARKEIGLAPLKGGAAHDFIQKLRVGPKPFLSPKKTPPQPVEQAWPSAWRLLYLPPHNFVRQLSDKPICAVAPATTPPTTHFEFLVTLRNPAVPTLHVFVGEQLPNSRTFGTHRGLYFLRSAEQLYLGKTDEFDVRLSHHIKNHQKHNDPVLWWVFVSPEQSVQIFTQDALGAAEALLISFWNEVSIVSNQNRGTDQKPAFTYLQQGVLLVEAASAVLLWLIRERNDLGLHRWSIPFKPWRGRNWPDCYIKLPD